MKPPSGRHVPPMACTFSFSQQGISGRKSRFFEMHRLNSLRDREISSFLPGSLHKDMVSVSFLIALTEYLTEIIYGGLFGSWLKGIQPFAVEKSVMAGRAAGSLGLKLWGLTGWPIKSLADQEAMQSRSRTLRIYSPTFVSEAGPTS